jgi:alkylated DNA repair dioxygenase AlkB
MRGAVRRLPRPRMDQIPLFEEPVSLTLPLPEGAVYQPGFLSAQEERELIELMSGLPLAHADYKGHTARRRVVSYGGRFDYDANRLQPGPALIEALHPLRARVAAWLQMAPARLAHVLVAEYAPGTPLGWHRDVPDFEEVAGVSLGASAILRFRPWPPVAPRRADIVRLEVARRSIYRLSGPARWAWQHSVAPVAALRWSITFRTLRPTAGGSRP